jgi:membrane protein YdbS with pleckstrin-like domain
MKFYITGEHVVVEKGVWWKKESTVPFGMITNVDKTQDPFERYYKIGKIHAQTAGSGGAQAAKAEAVIQGLKNLDEVKDEIKSRVRAKKGEPMPEINEMEPLSKILVEIKGLREDLKSSYYRNL